MTDSVVLDVIIGLFVMYFIASSLASVISEVVGMFVNRRANNMAQFVLDMFKPLDNPTPGALPVNNPAALTATHDAAQAAAAAAQARATAAQVAADADPADDTLAANAASATNAARIAGVKAAKVARIYDVVLPAANQTQPAAALSLNHATVFYGSTLFQNAQIGGLMGFVADLGRRLKAAEEKVPGSAQVLSITKDNFSQAVYEVLTDGLNAQQKVEADIASVKALVEVMPDSSLKAALVTAIQQADNSVATVVANVGKWFDGQMSQLSELYKRRTRIILFIIGLLLALILNLDSILVYNTLQNNPSLRATLVEYAKDLVTNDPAGIAPVTDAATV
ncbi:MAG: hypothetical protein ABI835_21130, partial [Chloroflexota bacterium]